jgi:colanic acid/amylovoran biosynthesis glycosyltransferase
MNSRNVPTMPDPGNGRIAIVTGWFPTVSETFVINHATGLIDLGLDVDLFAFKQTDEAIHPQLKDYRLFERVTYLPPELKATAAAVRQMTDKGYRAIHCHYGMIAERVAFLRPRMPGTRLFVTFHGLDIAQGLARGGGIYRSTFANADGVIAICQYNRDRLGEIGCPPAKLVDLPNSVDIDRFHFTERPVGEALRILTIARLHPDKNVPFALEVMQTLKRHGYAFNYTIIGDGEQRPEVERRITEYGLEDRVRLLGMCSQDEVIRQLARADLFFLPSRSEAFPVSLLEAQAMGLPVVSTNVGGTPEALIEGRTGYLVRPGDLSDAREKLARLLADRQLLVDMGRCGRFFVAEHFDARVMTKRCTELYGLGATGTGRRR